MNKSIGFIGLGRMGFSMSERLLRRGIGVIAYNRTPEKTRQLMKKGAVGVFSLEELVQKLHGKRRIVWMMLPGGNTTNAMIQKILPLLKKGDIVVNGANALYTEAQKHARWCEKYGVQYVDVGVSGGIHGLARGYALMIGGGASAFKRIEPVCRALAPKNGYAYFGAAGMGHFVKSVHNIVEYVYLEGLAEGAVLLKKQGIDVQKAGRVWQSGSIVSGVLLDWMISAIQRKDFSRIAPHISSVTEGELAATVRSVSGFAPAFHAAMNVRSGKKQSEFDFGKRLIAAMRREFGGHAVVFKKVRKHENMKAKK